MAQLNVNQCNIWLTYNFDQTSLSFLDLLISLQNGQVHTGTFRKETSANTLLYASSHHPQWLMNGIPVDQFLQLKRNCTRFSDYRRESVELYARFRERGYSHRQIRNARKKAAARDRQSLIQMHPPNPLVSKPEGGDCIRIITTFGPQWKEVRSILEKHWGVLTNSPGLHKIVGTSPLLVAHQARNLSDMLVRSEFTKNPDPTWLANYPRSKGMFPCNKCQICPLVHRTATFSDALGREQFEIRDLINCSTTRVVYMITCPCPKIYVGKTKRPL